MSNALPACPSCHGPRWLKDAITGSNLCPACYRAAAARVTMRATDTFRVAREFSYGIDEACWDEIVDESTGKVIARPTRFTSYADAAAECDDAREIETELHGDDGEPDALMVQRLYVNDDGRMVWDRVYPDADASH